MNNSVVVCSAELLDASGAVLCKAAVVALPDGSLRLSGPGLVSDGVVALRLLDVTGSTVDQVPIVDTVDD